MRPWARKSGFIFADYANWDHEHERSWGVAVQTRCRELRLEPGKAAAFRDRRI